MLKNKIIPALLFSAFCSVFLLAFRLYFSGHFTYIFLVWNLILAWVPLLLALSFPDPEKPVSLKTLTLLAGWLLFFPNAPYIITDLVHLEQKAGIPLWFDIVLLISFAWNGLIAGFMSLFRVQHYLQHKMPAGLSWLLVLGILMLSSFGIYLGRFQRWNSWDIIAQPLALFTDIAHKIVNPISNPQPVGVTLVFSIFLISSYLTFYFLARPVQQT